MFTVNDLEVVHYGNEHVFFVLLLLTSLVSEAHHCYEYKPNLL